MFQDVWMHKILATILNNVMVLYCYSDIVFCHLEFDNQCSQAVSFSKYWCTLQVAVNKSRNLQESFSIHGKVQFADNKIIHKYQLHGECSILQINTPVLHMHTIVTAKGGLKDFLNKRESLPSPYYCMQIHRKKICIRGEKKCCIVAQLLCNLFPNMTLPKLELLVISAIRIELYLETSNKSNKPYSMLQ